MKSVYRYAIIVCNTNRSGDIMEIKIEAPAKINLYLDVLSILDNGFHSIKSIMQTVTLSDDVSVSVEKTEKNSVHIACSNPDIPQDERNIAWKAADLYLRTFGINGYSVDIFIEKNIPVCAGLAGGSTDAAAVLLALNTLFEERASTPKLLECAAKLGSDVPFCLVKGTKLTENRGEEMKSVASMPDCTILICSSNESVSTAWAYGELDRIHSDFSDRSDSRESIQSMIDALNEANLKAVTDNMYNIFEDAVLPVCPKSSETKKLLLENGADNAMMSGSGSSVFGIFTDKTKAENAKKALETDERKVFLCRPQ